MKKYCVLLTGCGHRDGSEINEVVFSLLSLAQHNREYDIYAPDWDQYNTIDHVTGQEIKPNRNIFTESARLARGNLKKLNELKINDYAGLILPGGYGTLKNSTNFPVEDNNWALHPDIEKFIRTFHSAQKNIGAICIYPSILALLFKENNVKITIGLNPDNKNLIEFTGAEIVLCDSDEIVYDDKNNIVSTPAFMNDASLDKVFHGIDKMVDLMVRLES